MLERVEAFIRDFLASIQTARMYATAHPIFKKSVDKAYVSLEAILKEKDEVVIGIVGEELAFEKEIFFDLSELVKPEILYLKGRNIERIHFFRGTDASELGKFIAFLASPKDEIRKDPKESLNLLGITNISVGKTRISSTQEATPRVIESINILKLYESSTDKVSQSVTDVLEMDSLDHLSLRFSINSVLENLASQYKELLKLTTVKKHTLETFTHLLNVAILSMYFSAKLGFAKDAVLDIGIAALFHDIGKLYISRKVISKKGGLSEDEFAQIKSHTMLGAEIMLKYTDKLGILPVVVSFEHHLKYDLSGYPKIPYLEKQHIASRIISICDVYDALSERRGYKMDYPPDLIHNLMLKEKGTAFDPDLVERFFNVMGVWPIGSIVSLNDDRIAVVTDQHEEDKFSPKVEVIHPPDKKETIDLLERKETKIMGYLNPWREGKEYLHLIVPPESKKV